MSLDIPIRINPGVFCPETTASIAAWANFETLKVGWFGDESRIIDCELSLVDGKTFSDQLPVYQSNGALVAEQHGFALMVDKSTLKVEGMIAVDNKDNINKQLKLRVRKVLVILSATLSLSEVFKPY